jgi:hypothetical protein
MFNPWQVIVWRLIWYIPLQVFRWCFIACVFFGWGRYNAREMIRDTR